jgi:hypothetical protein
MRHLKNLIKIIFSKMYKASQKLNFRALRIKVLV